MSGSNTPKNYYDIYGNMPEDQFANFANFGLYYMQSLASGFGDQFAGKPDMESFNDFMNTDPAGFYATALQMYLASQFEDTQTDFQYPLEYKDIPETLPSTDNLTKTTPSSSQIRKLKVQRYLEKRKRRNFHKTVVYQCRKRVADSRIRVKGRFITKKEEEILLLNNGV